MEVQASMRQNGRIYLSPQCAPSGVNTSAAGAETRGERINCSTQVFRTRQGLMGDCHDVIAVRVDDSSSSTSALSGKKPIKKHASKSLRSYLAVKRHAVDIDRRFSAGTALSAG